MDALRTLIGPKGGLPTLKADLLRLASLLHVKVNESMTVEDLKNLCKPVVKDIKMDPPNSKTTSGSSSSQQAVGPVAKAPPTSSSLQANFQPVGQQEDARPPYMQDVHSLLMQQDQKFQAMLSQVMQHVMAMQSNQPTQHYPMNTEEWIEGQEPWREHDPQEENLMAQFGDLDFMSSDEISQRREEMESWK